MKSFHQIWAAILLATFGFVITPVQAADPVLGDWALIEFNADQTSVVGCNVVGGSITKYFDRLECGFLHASITQDGTPIANTSSVTYEIERPDGNIWITEPGVYRTVDDRWQLSFEFCNDYLLGFCAPALPAGEYTVRLIEVNGLAKNFGELKFTLNGMTATSLAASASPIAPGQAVTIAGVLNTIEEEPVTTQQSMQQINPVGGTFDVEVVDASNNVLGTILGESAAVDGTFAFSVPGSFTSSLTTNQTISVRIINADYDEVNGVSATTENWHAEVAGQVGVAINTGLGGGGDVTLHNSFVSSVGWVKPGETYPWRVFVENTTSTPLSTAIVTIPAVDGMTFSNVTPLGGAGTATMGGGSLITWNIGNVPQFSRVTLVVEAVADTAAQDPQIVWKDLSTTATLTWGLVGLTREDESHGPKVIPPLASYNTARFGDRPYVVVPADYTDRKHDPINTGDLLEEKLNDPNTVGSTFNLWQEVSFGQLWPHGAIGSAGVATADFTVDWNDPNRTDNEFTFSNNTPGGTCYGTDFSALAGTPAYPERVSGGWYQLPRDTAYYGGDRYGTALIGAIGGVGLIFAIDDACGPTGKAVYDSAHIADPEIDYNEFDSDKDGVVDFFMLVFVGTGGHGASQTSVPPYDNIWPHSSSLEFYFTDPATGLKGYVTDDQLKSLTEVPQCWTDTTYTVNDDCAANGGTGDDSLPTYVRVGPYNVNPEDSIENASVISHEYGHSLGLPDFYCTGGKTCYGDWNLMATDKSQHMDIFGKQEMGWIVPVPLIEGTTFASGWKESKHDTGEIHWQQPDGTPYTLSAANGHQNIHNAEAYVAKLPPALVIDPALVGSTEPGHDASPDNVWWSGAGNDFGCPGHTFDFALSPQEAPAGSTVTIEFGSWWEIEWDWDYGFVLVSTDLGSTWQSLQSNNAYTTPGAFNPNANGCQQQYGNGITGTSGSYLAATDAVDRATGSFTPATRFTTDNYTFVMPSGGNPLLVRFAYATDPAVAGRGWFIDNLRVDVDGTEVFGSDFEDDDGNGRWAGDGWSLISATLGSQADRAYYLEMRDRTGFDHTGNGENDRAALNFNPGLLLVITDEVKGYGNTGSGDHPNQSPVDATPVPGNTGSSLVPNAAFRDAPGVSHYNDFTDDGDDGWHDNYEDSTHPSGDWVHDYNCLSFDVTAMTGESSIGPNYPIPGDLVGDVTFNIGPVGPDNCGEFIYWPPIDCFDIDADGLCDPIDNCPLVSNVDQMDQDGDGVGDLCDNCLAVQNADQCNTNSHEDNFGNVCDADLNNDNIVNSFDLTIMRQNFGAMGSGNDSDLNCDDIVNSFDLTIMRNSFGLQPGPTGIQ